MLAASAAAAAAGPDGVDDEGCGRLPGAAGWGGAAIPIEAGGRRESEWWREAPSRWGSSCIGYGRVREEGRGVARKGWKGVRREGGLPVAGSASLRSERASADERGGSEASPLAAGRGGNMQQQQAVGPALHRRGFQLLCHCRRREQRGCRWCVAWKGCVWGTRSEADGGWVAAESRRSAWRPSLCTAERRTCGHARGAE